MVWVLSLVCLIAVLFLILVVLVRFWVLVLVWLVFFIVVLLVCSFNSFFFVFLVFVLFEIFWRFRRFLVFCFRRSVLWRVVVFWELVVILMVNWIDFINEFLVFWFIGFIDWMLMLVIYRLFWGNWNCFRILFLLLNLKIEDLIIFVEF